jgi:hypothetical protein
MGQHRLSASCSRVGAVTHCRLRHFLRKYGAICSFAVCCLRKLRHCAHAAAQAVAAACWLDFHLVCADRQTATALGAVACRSALVPSCGALLQTGLAGAACTLWAWCCSWVPPWAACLHPQLTFWWLSEDCRDWQVRLFLGGGLVTRRHATCVSCMLGKCMKQAELGCWE